MAEALLSSLFSTVWENLNSQILKQFGIASGLTTEINTLKSTFTTIQAVLQDAEAKQWKSEALRDWLGKLKGAAYDVEDILDEISTEALRRRGFQNQVSTFFSLRNQLLFRFKMGRKVKDMRERLDAIAEERSQFHLREGAVDAQVGAMTCSLVTESDIIGRNEEKEMIIEKLLNNLNDEHDLSVYAIRGMGGLGKTTLAQLVYNDERVETHFELRIWVCVSNDFDIRRLTRAIIESIGGVPGNILELDSLQRLLQENLRGRKFLLVLDDVWNEYPDKWDGLKQALRCGAKGSMVVVTTRIEKVALIMATLPVHHMGILSEDDSWSLFRRRAFDRREENLQLETIGKAIVKKCGGFPLAIKALGSLMQLKRSEKEWLFVRDSEIWDLAEHGVNILPALGLSYDNLSSHSKRCFVYCCIFPKDYRMKKDMLIELWMANGFIPSKGRQTDLHDMGHRIFDDLFWRSFFQDVKEDYEGDLTCKMHDMVHDLAQFIMRGECSIIDTGEVLKIPDEVRHLYFVEPWRSSQQTWKEDMTKLKSLHSLILNNASSLYMSKQRFLRVLHLNCDYSMKVVPKSIGKLIHLRYLAVSNGQIKNLPESISSLQNLQTLKLKGCRKLEKLPKGMRYMRNLRCLDIRGCDRLVCMPAGMGQLSCLQALSIFIVGEDRGQQIGELKELNLGGELSIKGVDNVRDSVDAKSANLRSKQNLISLSLCWRGNNKGGNLAEEVLEGLQPHSNLKKLEISSYEGLQFPKWMLDSVLQNLVKIKLTDCRRCEQLPPLGKLAFLRVVDINGMDGIKYLNNEFYGDGENSFPALEKLYLGEMRNLEEWKSADRGESFPCLLDLHVKNCPRLTELPRLPRLERLLISGGNVMLVTQVTNLTSLSSLEIGECSSLESLPEGLRNLNSLERLSVSGCDSLTSFPPNGLSSLKSLSVWVCKKLECLSEGVQHLTALQELEILYCPEMKSFPEGMQNLTHLRTLSISDCQGLTSLPNSLGSLLSLSVGDCRNMISLPDGLQSLEFLRIYGCPDLERRCKKEKGEDWPKIAHIPTIGINGQRIQSISS